MGFRVVGPRTFIASGHPDLREDRPVRLGLIESDDAGTTWAERSLGGEADFHDLEISKGVIYGIDSSTGSVLATTDRRTWETRSRVVVTDLAVSPRNPDVLVGVVGRGTLARSVDGARSFAPVAEAPAAALVAWSPDGPYALTANGTVFRSVDDGRSWTASGSLSGEPAAFTATEEALYAGLHDGRIMESTDRGASWTVRDAGRKAAG
jgi:photosystem II stability/assembly factor-like uncharacterized protein